ncbi:hypothetical protein [Gandjariella thermophila]|uniref:IPT/TIG domain-containing protein n=1 Tax=Gandjariella thermophila TaxID=1931992 RepID=A0A4D4JHB3_9PSEU|nr:hypothetical protein [Gandjariella thermophila]GDY33679.1 hypothetical protein GTS_53120 [Gandjariella thermophila]
MKRRLKDLVTWSRLWSAAGVAAALTLMPVVAAPASAGGSCMLATPPFGPPTTQVTLRGCGFGAHEIVRVYFGQARVATAWTDSDGYFSSTFNVPASTEGATVLLAVGDRTRMVHGGAFMVLSETWHSPNHLW